MSGRVLAVSFPTLPTSLTTLPAQTLQGSRLGVLAVERAGSQPWWMWLERGGFQGTQKCRRAQWGKLGFRQLGLNPSSSICNLLGTLGRWCLSWSLSFPLCEMGRVMPCHQGLCKD